VNSKLHFEYISISCIGIRLQVDILSYQKEEEAQKCRKTACREICTCIGTLNNRGMKEETLFEHVPKGVEWEVLQCQQGQGEKGGKGEGGIY
jgi:hypothetical protein